MCTDYLFSSKISVFSILLLRPSLSLSPDFLFPLGHGKLGYGRQTGTSTTPRVLMSDVFSTRSRFLTRMRVHVGVGAIQSVGTMQTDHS